jgi:hypothetical protein
MKSFAACLRASSVLAISMESFHATIVLVIFHLLRPISPWPLLLKHIRRRQLGDLGFERSAPATGCNKYVMKDSMSAPQLSLSLDLIYLNTFTYMHQYHPSLPLLYRLQYILLLS